MWRFLLIFLPVYDIISVKETDTIVRFFIAHALLRGLFVITKKGVLMNKISYMGDGQTTKFNFNFPYFDTTNIIVTKNNQETSGFSIIGTKSGENADMPYNGGAVIFESAPLTTDSITIVRKLSLERSIDYQPTGQIDPTTLNQDMNYLMEVIKDRKDELDELITQYSEIADKESTTTLLARISAIHNEIVEIDAKITALGDLSTIRSDITGLKDASNLTPTGKSNLAHLAMPSTTYTDLTLGVSGSTYTAPADGWFVLIKEATAANQYVDLSGAGGIETGATASGAQYLYTQLPASKDSIVTIYYNADGDTVKFRFIYANGAN